MNLKTNLALTLLLFSACALQAAEKPLWTAGFMSDTHVSRKRDATFVRLACRQFNRLGADLVVNLGDICDVHWAPGYEAIRKAYDEELVKPHEEIFVCAYHDWVHRTKEPHDVVMKDVLAKLGAKHEPGFVREFRGCPIVVFPQCRPDYAAMEKTLREVAAKHPDPKTPIFVFDHEPGADTTARSLHWGDRRRRALYAKFPRIVLLSGHTHGLVWGERFIWQGEYTAVNAGDQQSEKAAALFMEVYPDRLVFRRVRIGDGLEPLPPWVVPLPFDAATAPYAPERRKAATPAPEFASGAALKLTPAGEPFERLELEFPHAGETAATYRIDILDGEGMFLARRSVPASYGLTGADRPPAMTAELSAGYFEKGRSYRVSVTPLTFFDTAGRAIEASFMAPARKGTLVWESKDPMKDCPFMTGLEGGKPVPLENGWYKADGGAYRLELPKGVWNGKKDEPFRFIVDCATEQRGAKPWSMVLRNPDPSHNANGRVYTESGDLERIRYVMEIRKVAAKDHYYLLVREGSGGRIRFLNVRIERP